MNKRRLIFSLFLLGIFLPFSFALAGTVSGPDQYAWSNNVGYINFANLIVDDNVISGYAWSKNSGWIKFNPANGGVFNDGQGHLSGYAWGTNLGWINFSNVVIDPATGQFFGIATGTLIGTLTFNCPNYCDVRTDWRPTAVASVQGAGALPLYNSVLPLPPYVETHNENLTLVSDQSGHYIQDTISGPVAVNVPANDVSGQVTFLINIESLTPGNNHLVLSGLQLVNNVFYNISARDQNGGLIHSFFKPLTISLPIPANLQKTKDLAVYWLNDSNQQWVLIPDAVFVDQQATFQVSHLTEFAIFSHLSLASSPNATSSAIAASVPTFKSSSIKPSAAANAQTAATSTLVFPPSFSSASGGAATSGPQANRSRTGVAEPATTSHHSQAKSVSGLLLVVMVLILGSLLVYRRPPDK